MPVPASCPWGTMASSVHSVLELCLLGNGFPRKGCSNLCLSGANVTDNRERNKGSGPH